MKIVCLFQLCLVGAASALQLPLIAPKLPPNAHATLVPHEKDSSKTSLTLHNVPTQQFLWSIHTEPVRYDVDFDANCARIGRSAYVLSGGVTEAVSA